MAEKNKIFDKFTLAVIVIIIMILSYFIYYLLSGLRETAVSVSYQMQPVKEVNAGAFAIMKDLNACGNWPLTTVNLSADRGNPFSRKGSVLPQMVATSSVSCLPVTQ